MASDGLGLAASSSGGFGTASAEAMFSSGGMFSGANPLLSSTNTPSPDAHFPAPSTSASASTPPFAAAAPSPHHAGTGPASGRGAGHPQPDPAVVEAHILESVMAVVERCKSGTLEIPDHYIKPSDFPPPKQARPTPAPQSHHKAANHHHARPAHQPLPAHHQVKQQQQQRVRSFASPFSPRLLAAKRPSV